MVGKCCGQYGTIRTEDLRVIFKYVYMVKILIKVTLFRVETG